MHVDPPVVLLGQVEDPVHLGQPEFAGRLVVWNPADAIGAELQRVLQQFLVARIGVDPVLRERGHLHGDQIGHVVAHPEQPPERHLVLGRDVGVSPDEQRALRGRPLDHLLGSGVDVVLGQALLELAPYMDALNERAGLVEPGSTRRERRIEMEVAVDQRRADQAAPGIDGRDAIGRQIGTDAGPPAVPGQQIDQPIVTIDAGVGDEQVAGVHVPSTLRPGDVRPSMAGCITALTTL